MADKSRALAARMRTRNQLAEISSPITVGRLPKPAVKTESLAPLGDKVASGTGGASAADEIRKNAPVRPRSPRPLAKAFLGGEQPGTVTIKPVRETNIFVQAGAYSRFDNANKARARLSSVGPVKVTSVLIKGRDIFHVRVGPMPTVKDADKFLELVIGAGYPDARIIVD
jgi:rare lipoprotein A